MESGKVKTNRRRDGKGKLVRKYQEENSFYTVPVGDPYVHGKENKILELRSTV